MNIGTKNFSDECPECGEIKGWLKKPGGRIVQEGGHSYSTFSIVCLKCGYETETVKILDDYLRKKQNKMEGVTPKKSNIFNRIFNI
jgi:hypothetical protein